MLTTVWKSWRKNVGAWLFLAPAVGLTALFFVYPLLKVVQMSLYKWSVLGTNRFLGWGNYDRLINDPLFWESLKNTVIYTLIVTPAIFLPAMGLALLLNNTWKGTTLFRAVYFLSVAISFVVASLVWLWIYNEMYGILNYVLLSIGFISKRISWLGSTWMARLSVSMMIAWKTTGFSMVILLAGLQGIPKCWASFFLIFFFRFLVSLFGYGTHNRNRIDLAEQMQFALSGLMETGRRHIVFPSGP